MLHSIIRVMLVLLVLSSCGQQASQPTTVPTTVSAGGLTPMPSATLIPAPPQQPSQVASNPTQGSVATALSPTDAPTVALTEVPPTDVPPAIPATAAPPTATPTMAQLPSQAGKPMLIFLQNGDTVVQADPANGQIAGTIATIPLDTGEEVAFLSMSPRGGTLLYGTVYKDAQSSAMRMYRFVGEQPEFVALVASAPRWSNDGEQFIVATLDQATGGAGFLLLGDRQGTTSVIENSLGALDVAWDIGDQSYSFIAKEPDGQTDIGSRLVKPNDGPSGADGGGYFSSSDQPQWTLHNILVTSQGETWFFGLGGGSLANNGNNLGWYRMIDGKPQAVKELMGATMTTLATSKSYVASGIDVFGGAGCAGDSLAVFGVDGLEAVKPVWSNGVNGRVRGMTFDPNDSAILYYSFQPDECTVGEHNYGTAQIYLEDVTGAGGKPLAEGEFPVVVRP